MELLVLLAESQVLEQLTPATKTTILVEHRQGLAVKMDSGQAKNQPARVSFNGERGTNQLMSLKRAEKIE
jgi:hypothetical protein